VSWLPPVASRERSERSRPLLTAWCQESAIISSRTSNASPSVSLAALYWRAGNVVDLDLGELSQSIPAIVRDDLEVDGVSVGNAASVRKLRAVASSRRHHAAERGQVDGATAQDHDALVTVGPELKSQIRSS
jgi:hypothetical protein